MDTTRMRELLQIAKNPQVPMSTRMQAAKKYETFLDKVAGEMTVHLAYIKGPISESAEATANDQGVA